MENARLSGQTILVVQTQLDSAIPLQDRIVKDGGRVLTAYTLARALLLAEGTELSGAVIDREMDGADQIVHLLKTRNVPHVIEPQIGESGQSAFGCSSNPILFQVSSTPTWS